jgi:hypothetical protein
MQRIRSGAVPARQEKKSKKRTAKITKEHQQWIHYSDADGGLRGVVFTIPVGKAKAIKTKAIKTKLVTLATRTTTSPPRGGD